MLSRWKLMAGVLGVSIGGLAAAASQCPKWDKSKGRSPETPVAKADDGKLPPAGAKSESPPRPEVPPLPAAPQLTPAGSTSAPLPPAPMLDGPPPPAPAAPAANTLPPVPEFPAFPAATDTKPGKPEATPVVVTSPGLPMVPTAGPTAPAVKPEAKPIPPMPPAPGGDLLPPAEKPATPPAITPGDMPAPAPLATPPAPGGVFESLTPPKGAVPPPTPAPMKPEVAHPDKTTPPANAGRPTAVAPPVVGASGAQMPIIGGTTPPALPATGIPGSAPGAPPANIDPSPTPVQPVPAQIPPAAAEPAAEKKFRILLHVGDGEPTFEVKTGDNLVLKVACDKVDIKSPEKGGLSEVTARGKVRFAGFGAEGTCDELKFMAGTGEVSMTGAVKVQVKDKLGRVESELSTGSMKYKLDSSAVGGQLKP